MWQILKLIPEAFFSDTPIIVQKKYKPIIRTATQISKIKKNGNDADRAILKKIQRLKNTQQIDKYEFSARLWALFKRVRDASGETIKTHE